MDIIIASKNKHKIEEINSILNGTGFNCIGSPIEYDDVEETGTTFEENASIKSDFLSLKLPNALVIADDSGIEVDALNKLPGVYSARYAGEHGNDKENNKKLLKDMEGIFNRSCRFVCVITISKNGKTLQSFRGTVEGTLGYEEKGDNGFGYDPLFVLPSGLTTAELPSNEKNKISHRYNALVLMKDYLLNNKL